MHEAIKPWNLTWRCVMQSHVIPSYLSPLSLCCSVSGPPALGAYSCLEFVVDLASTWNPHFAAASLFPSAPRHASTQLERTAPAGGKSSRIGQRCYMRTRVQAAVHKIKVRVVAYLVICRLHGKSKHDFRGVRETGAGLRRCGESCVNVIAPNHRKAQPSASSRTQPPR